MKSGRLLDNINSPLDIKKLSLEELDCLCNEIRAEIINTVSHNGGHLASNLGVVELTVAIHKVFDSPKDQIVWDVSHQCYAHKLLTGRKEEFDTIRKLHGISGFTKIRESEHDPYGAGHSSTSISAAAGLARAKSLCGDDGSVVAVIGDGALSGGLAYEGLNNAGRNLDKLIIILNDNKMSISKNTGAMARHLAILRIKPWYFKVKDCVEKGLEHTPIIGKRIRNALLKSKSFIKNAIYHSSIFEEMGFVYLGPVDGHNIDQIMRVLERAKGIKRPSLVHVMTVKGKGYTFAEDNPGIFHGVSKFDIDTGDPISTITEDTYSEIFGKAICELAKDDERIVAITAAMKANTGLTQFSKEYKNRFFDVGIAEEHAVVFSAGLAANGMIPVFAVYSTFLQRAYDQLIHDAALQKLNIVLAVDRAGIVGEDGETHQGIYDVAFLTSIPGMTVFSPATAEEIQEDLTSAMYECSGPAAVRYPRGAPKKLSASYKLGCKDYDYFENKDADILLVTYGRLFFNIANARDTLEDNKTRFSILKLNKIYPINRECLEQAKNYKKVIFYEEGVKFGGVCEHFETLLFESGFKGSYKINAIENQFVEQGNVEQLFEKFGFDTPSIAKALVQECKN